MTTTGPLNTPAVTTEPALAHRPDHRGSWVPNGAMITTRIMELRKRRGMMAALIAVNIGLPAAFLIFRLLAHAFDPHTYGPAGGYDIFNNMVSGVMYIFGFIVAALVGCTAGAADLTEGMFRHLVVTGRSRLALYFARIPAGLAIVLPIVAIGFTFVCLVCTFAAPSELNYDGMNVPAGLNLTQFEHFAAQHPADVDCYFPFNGNVQVNIQCGPNGPILKQSPGAPPLSTHSQLVAAAVQIASQNYGDYRQQFLAPPVSVMIESGLWISLEAVLGFVIGLGLASLLGQRTLAVVLMIVLEVILTPILSRHAIPHLINLQRAVVGLAMIHVRPLALPPPFGGNSGPNEYVAMSTTAAICVIVAWIVGWTAIGAWRMATRDA